MIKTVKKVRQDLTWFFDKMCELYGADDVIYELMQARGYVALEMFETLKEVGVFKVDYLSDITLFLPQITSEQFDQWGLLTESGDFILSGRYVLPIRSINGEVVALVGWHPKGGSRKYVTTPTLGYSRDATFFNLDTYSYSWDKWKGVVYLVEGIFDTLALRSLGLPALGVQGLNLSSIKVQMLTRFSKVIVVPDNDRGGRSVNPYTNSSSGKSKKMIWKLINDSVFVLLPSPKDIFIRLKLKII